MRKQACTHTHTLTHSRTHALTCRRAHTCRHAHTSSNTGRDTAIITATATWHRTVRWDPTSSFSLRSRRLGLLSRTPILRLPTHRDGVTKPLALKVHDACVDETRRNTAAKQRSAAGTHHGLRPRSAPWGQQNRPGHGRPQVSRLSGLAVIFRRGQ